MADRCARHVLRREVTVACYDREAWPATSTVIRDQQLTRIHMIWSLSTATVFFHATALPAVTEVKFAIKALARGQQFPVQLHFEFTSLPHPNQPPACFFLRPSFLSWGSPWSPLLALQLGRPTLSRSRTTVVKERQVWLSPDTQHTRLVLIVYLTASCALLLVK